MRFLFLAGLFLASAITTAQGKKPFAVADVLKVEAPGISPSIGQTPFAWSPDHRRFYAILRGYDLPTDSFCNRLLVFSAADVEAYLAASRAMPAPAAQFRFCMSSDEEVEDAISQVRWMPDSRRIALIARTEKHTKQIVVIDTASGIETQLTREVSDVHSFDWVGDTLIYTVAMSEEISRKQPFFVEREGLLELLGISPYRTPPGFKTIILDQRTGRRTTTTEPVINMSVAFQRLRLSPDARFAAALRPARIVPTAWQEYRLPFNYRFKPTTREFSDQLALQHVLIDTRTGSVRPLLDAPTRDVYAEVYWTSDSADVVLASTLLPLDGVSADERDRRAGSPAAVEIRVSDGRISFITFRPFNSLQPVATQWDMGAERLQFTEATKDGKTRFAFAKSHGEWQPTPADSMSGSMPLEISIKRPVSATADYWVTHRATGATKPITNTNDALREIAVSPTRELEFLDRAGRKWVAGLIEPSNAQSGKPYPLLVQTHGYWGGLILDGAASSGYAAQALAAKGVAVLQLSDRYQAIGLPDEADIHMQGIESAVEKLVADGLVDPARVALMGFSRSCYYVRFALVNSKIKFAAAIVVDGLDAGYVNYLHAVNSPAEDLLKEYERVNGGAPFGDGLDKWRERAPGFNLHRVGTPLLIQALGRRSPRSEWEFFAGLKVLGKPVEMLVHPISPHIPVRPSQILAAQNATVDWVLFWLKGEERAGMQRIDQYRRWRSLQRH